MRRGIQVSFRFFWILNITMGDQENIEERSEERQVLDKTDGTDDNAPRKRKKKLVKSKPETNITLPRLRIIKGHYFVLAVFTLTGFMVSKSAIIYFDAYYQSLMDYRFTGLPAVLLIIACLTFIAFSIDAARAHSKDYDSNITNVFEYMKRQGKAKFTYTLEKDPHLDHFGVVELIKIRDNVETGEPEVVVKTVPSVMSSNAFPVERKIKVSEIKEIKLVNQRLGFSKESDFIEINEQIRNMLKSDRQQLIAFVGAYLFAMLTGFFLALIF